MTQVTFQERMYGRIQMIHSNMILACKHDTFHENKSIHIHIIYIHALPQRGTPDRANNLHYDLRGGQVWQTPQPPEATTTMSLDVHMYLATWIYIYIYIYVYIYIYTFCCWSCGFLWDREMANLVIS